MFYNNLWVNATDDVIKRNKFTVFSQINCINKLILVSNIKDLSQGLICDKSYTSYIIYFIYGT